MQYNLLSEQTTNLLYSCINVASVIQKCVVSYDNEDNSKILIDL